MPVKHFFLALFYSPYPDPCYTNKKKIYVFQLMAFCNTKENWPSQMQKLFCRTFSLAFTLHLCTILPAVSPEPFARVSPTTEDSKLAMSNTNIWNELLCTQIHKTNIMCHIFSDKYQKNWNRVHNTPLSQPNRLATQKSNKEILYLNKTFKQTDLIYLKRKNWNRKNGKNNNSL